jgi:MFS family permease
MGIGVGLAAGPSTAAILEFSSPEHAKSAATVTMVAQAVGFVAALLQAALATQVPLRTTAMIKEAPASVRAAVEQSMPPAGGRFILGRWASLLALAALLLKQRRRSCRTDRSSPDSGALPPCRRT